jgi:flavin-dependent dehydrogenase
MIVTGANGIRVTGRYGSGQQGFAVPRRLLDARLAAAAVAAGARLEERAFVQAPLIGARETVTGVELASPDGRRQRYTARVVIAADGRTSRLSRALQLTRTPDAPRRWAIGGVFEGVSGLSSCGEMHVRLGGYLGVAPLPGGIANACVVTADRTTLRRPGLLVETLRAEPETASRFAHAHMIAGPFVLGPLALDAVAAGAPGLLLAGDAAGFIDPMTGDGLRFAFRGAELAAAEALRALAHGWCDAHVRLLRARRRAFGAKWRFNRTLRALVASPAAVRAAGTGARVAPVILRRVVRYAGDVTAA